MCSCSRVHTHTHDGKQSFIMLYAAGRVPSSRPLPPINRFRLCCRPGSLSRSDSCRQWRPRCSCQEPHGSTSSHTLRQKLLRLPARGRIPRRGNQSPHPKPGGCPPGPWWARMWAATTTTRFCWAEGTSSVADYDLLLYIIRFSCPCLMPTCVTTYVQIGCRFKLPVWLLPKTHVHKGGFIHQCWVFTLICFEP